MNKKAEWEWGLVVVGLTLITGCIYIVSLYRVGPIPHSLDLVMLAGMFFLTLGNYLLGKAVLSRKLVNIAVFLVGLIILVDATRVAWLGEQWPGGFNGNQFLVKLIAGPVLLGIAKILSDYRLRHPDVFIGLFFVGDWFLFSSIGPLPINLASWSAAMTFIAWFFFVLSLYVPFERSEL